MMNRTIREPTARFSFWRVRPKTSTVIPAVSWLTTDTQSLESSLQARRGVPGLCPPTSVLWKSGSPIALKGSSLGSPGCRCRLYHEGLLLSLSSCPGTFSPSLESLRRQSESVESDLWVCLNSQSCALLLAVGNNFPMDAYEPSLY